MKFLVPLEVSLISSEDVSRRKFVNSLEQLIAHSAYAATILVGSDPFIFYLHQKKPQFILFLSPRLVRFDPQLVFRRSFGRLIAFSRFVYPFHEARCPQLGAASTVEVQMLTIKNS